MNYVIAAWAACGAILLAYAARTYGVSARCAVLWAPPGRQVTMSPPTKEVVLPVIDREPSARPAQVPPGDRPAATAGHWVRGASGWWPCVVILGALAFLMGRGLTNAMDYYLTAKQAVAQRAQLGQQDFRIQGTVLPGLRQVGTTLHFSIGSGRRAGQRGEHRFAAAAVPRGHARRARRSLARARLRQLPDNGPARVDLRRGPPGQDARAAS